MYLFRLQTAIASLISICLLSPAMADAVTDWNEKALSAGNAARQTPAGQTPAQQARNIAIVHLAMFDALNSIEPRYTPYRVQLKVPNTTSREAAASAAAHYLIVRLYPAQSKDADAALQAELALVPDGPDKTQGAQLGEKVAAALLEERSTDGADATDTYRPYGAAGAYVPTILTASWNWGLVKPFAMKSGNQFRLARPRRSPARSGQGTTTKSRKWAPRPGRGARPSKPTRQNSGSKPEQARTIKSYNRSRRLRSWTYWTTRVCMPTYISQPPTRSLPFLMPSTLTIFGGR